MIIEHYFLVSQIKKILPVKKALSENKPIEFGMYCCSETFCKLSGNGYWNPNPNEYTSMPKGGHALVVIGYDDEINGGSFEIMNSWGEAWGNQGFAWIKYFDFNVFSKYAFEMIPNPPLVVDLNGSMNFQTLSGETMVASYNTDENQYKMNKPYRSGTKFRFY